MLWAPSPPASVAYTVLQLPDLRLESRSGLSGASVTTRPEPSCMGCSGIIDTAE